MNYYIFELGLSNGGFNTPTWEMPADSIEQVRSLIGVLVKGMFDTEETDENGGRYLKVRGKDKAIVEWASKGIRPERPDVNTCELPEPLIKE